MVFFLYAVTAPLLLWLIDRFVRKLSWTASIVLFVLPLVLTGRALVTGGVYGPLDHLYQDIPLQQAGSRFGVGDDGARNASAVDVISQFFPWRLAVQASLGRGEWPLWNGYNLCGHPLAAEAQAAPYSPFTLLACLLPAAVSLSYSAAIGFFLAAASAFLFARELGCGEGAALFAAAGWAFAASIVVYSLTAMGLTTVYMPLLLAAVHRLLRHPGLAAGAVLTTALAVTALQGHPESLFLNVLVACVYALFELVRGRALSWRAIVTAIGAGVVAALLTAIFLLPVLEAIPQSIEYRGRVDSTGARHGVSGQEFLANLATDVFPHLHVRSWARPGLGFIGVETAAVGSLVLAFALYATWRRRSTETWFFAAMAILCAVVGARWEPIAGALQHVPLLSITHYERLAFAAALFLVTLAAIGVQEMLRRRDFRAAAATLAGLLLALSLGLWWIRAHVVLATTRADYGRQRIFAELFFLAAAALLLALLPRPRIIVPALLTLLVAQRWMAERETFATFPAEAAYPPVPLFESLSGVSRPFRIVGSGDAFPPAANTYYNLEDPRGYEALTLDPFARTWKLWCQRQGIWFNRVDDLTSPFLSFLNVRYAVQADDLPVPVGWRRIASQPGASLLENDAALDRIFIPKTVVLSTASTEEIVDRMAATRDFREVAWISARSAMTERANGPGRITLRTRSLGGLYDFDADMKRDGWVVLSVTAWKGWQATIDGNRVALNRANAAFLAVSVPAGHHNVRLRYLPWSFVVGRRITFVTLFAIALFAVARAFLVRLPEVRLVSDDVPARA